MRKQILCLMLVASAFQPAWAGVFTSGDVTINSIASGGTALNTTILDGNPNGLSFNINVSGALPTLTAVTVTLNIAGGYNGDLYAYLAYNGTLVTLLNQVGTGSGDMIQSTFGFSTSGFNNVTLGATGSNIHGVESPTTGITYTPDGGSLSSFNGGNPNGTWTLFLADLSGGSVSTLNGWGLDITAVPEPVNTALGIFGVALVVGGFARRQGWLGKSSSI